MGKITWLLDPGHGGMIPDGNGGLKYATAPHKMFVHDDGMTLYEGVYNRQIIDLVKIIMRSRGMHFIDIVNSEYDIPLKERVSLANYHGKNKRCAYFSMHGNAANRTASGIEIYTSKGETLSDKFATEILTSIEEEFPNEKYRKDTWSDGDVDKEENFYVLINTSMPAVLLELWFFDNYKDALKMNDPSMRQRAAKAIVNGFEKIENKY